MLRLILIFVLSAFALEASSQVPGYFGKRKSLTFESQWSLATSNPTANAASTYNTVTGIYETPWGVNWQVGLRGAYTYARMREVVFSAGYIRTGLNFEENSELISFGTSRTNNHNLLYNIAGPSVEIGLRKYRARKGGLAPLGRNRTLLVQCMRLNSDLIRDEINYVPAATDSIVPVASKANVTYWSLGYEVGQNFVFRDKMLFSIGCRFNLPFRFFRSLYLETDSSDNLAWYEENLISRVALHSLITIKASVGFIF